MFEFNEFEPRLKSVKNRFQLSAGLNLKNFNTILSGTNHIWAAAKIIPHLDNLYLIWIFYLLIWNFIHLFGYFISHLCNLYLIWIFYILIWILYTYLDMFYLIWIINILIWIFHISFGYFISHLDTLIANDFFILQ